MFRSLSGACPFFASYMKAVAKGDMAPLQALEKLKLSGITAKVAQRLFLRQAVHENLLEMQKEQNASPITKEQLLNAFQEIRKAFEHLNNDDSFGHDDSLVLLHWL